MSFDDLDEYTEEHERRITRCKSCNKQIIFLATAAGKKMPVDADTVEPEDELFDPARHESHFRTCDNPNRFSGRNR